MAEDNPFQLKMHIGFLKHMFNVLPNPYSSQDSNKTMLIYFTVGSLDLLGALTEQEQKQTIDYIYCLQTLPDPNNPGFKIVFDIFKINFNILNFFYF